MLSGPLLTVQSVAEEGVARDVVVEDAVEDTMVVAVPDTAAMLSI